MSAAMDILGAVVRVLATVAPQLVQAIEAGATEQGLSASLTLAVRASAETARARVDARTGHALIGDSTRQTPDWCPVLAQARPNDGRSGRCGIRISGDAWCVLDVGHGGEHA